MGELTRFVGTWELVTGHSDYGFGIPPTRATYRIDDTGNGGITVESHQVNRHGRERSLIFDGTLGGGRQSIGDSPVADELCFALTAPDVLRSAAFRDGHRVQWAERRIAGDDATLTITVHGHLSDGAAYRNSDLYRRV